MRGDILVQNCTAMDGDLSSVIEPHSKSPRSVRRSRIDRLHRGNIDSVKEFQRSFDELDNDEVDNTISTQDVGDGISQIENSLPQIQNNEELIEINVIGSTPISKVAPYSIEEQMKRADLSISSPTKHRQLSSPCPADMDQVSEKPVRRVTVHCTYTTEPKQNIVVKKRANTAPRVPSELIRRNVDDSSSANSTPSGSPSLRRRSGLDITSTPLYKELYANNLRSYGFLLYKDKKKAQGVSEHDDKIKKRRRKGQNTLFSSSRQLRRHTDIPKFIEQKGSYSADEAAVSSDDDKHLQARPSLINRRMTDLGSYNLYEKAKVNKIVDKRKTEAQKRQEYRSARMKSLDEIINKVNNMLHPSKKRDSNSTTDLSKLTAEETDLNKTER